MRDYGGDISCPTCGHIHHVTPRQLQGDFQIVFICEHCGTEVVHDNKVAQEIAARIEGLRPGFEKLKI
jgi:DNA-directed RNA polymerase subunit RPC12/RpoP